MGEIWDRDPSSVSRVTGRSVIVCGMAWSEVGIVVIVVPHGTRDLQREAREPFGHTFEGRLRRVARKALFTLQAELERPASAAGSADGSAEHLLRSHGTVCSDVASADALLAIGEDEGLRTELTSLLLQDEGRLTVKMLITLMTMARIPAEITIRQNANPRDVWLMASMFRLPSVAIPRIIMMPASAMKPASSPNRGQLRLK